MKRLAWVLIAGLAAVGCDDEEAVTTADLVGITWQLTLFQDATAAPVQVADPSRYTLRFGNDGRAAAMSDCNACGGPYSLDGAVFRMGPMVCTRAFCGATSLDPAYPTALEKARGVSMETPAQLTIHGDGVTLFFRSQP